LSEYADQTCKAQLSDARHLLSSIARKY